MVNALPGTSAYKAMQYKQRTGQSATFAPLIATSGPLAGTSSYKAMQYKQRTGQSATFAPLIATSGPLAGTSSYKAMQYYNRTGESATWAPLGGEDSPAAQLVREVLNPSKPTRGGSPSRPAGDEYVSGPSSAVALDYLNADLAKHYGMSRETAYSEALSNTAYQRAVKDMQAAGLNPAVLFGAGRAATADGVSYISDGSIGSGGSGGSRRSYSGSSRSNGKLFSSGAYGAISSVAGLVGAAMTKNPTGFWIGSTVAKGLMGAANSLFGGK